MKITGLSDLKPAKPNISTIRRGDKELVTLTCGHTTRVCDAIVIVMLGDKLGAELYCDRCADWFHTRKTRKKKKSSLPDTPLF